MKASLAAQRPARCSVREPARLALAAPSELTASRRCWACRRSNGEKTCSKVDPGRASCSAKPGMWTRSTPTARASCLLSIRAWLQQVAAQTSVIVKQDCGFAFLDCVTGAAEVAVNRTLIQGRATGDSRGQTLQTSCL